VYEYEMKWMGAGCWMLWCWLLDALVLGGGTMENFTFFE
jgi:hypothetical protein